MKVSQPRAPELNTLADYRARFADARYWEPFVRQVCGRQDLGPCQSIRCEVPGTCPVFIVDDRWVVKFFGFLFDGASAFAAELEANQLVAVQGQVPMPSVMASGYLLESDAEWRWPYLIFEYVPGESVGSVFDRIAYEDRVAVARELGTVTRSIHNTVLDGAVVLRPSWETYATMLQQQRALCVQRHMTWHSLPDHLVAQIDQFLLPPAALVQRHTVPVLLHADITGDHVLGHTVNGHWRMYYVIDFGDAIVGAREYELLPLHLDVFHCDKRLLGAYLVTYGMESWWLDELPRVAMSLALLHRFNVLESVFGRFPMAENMKTLEELSTCLWDPQAPGLTA